MLTKELVQVTTRNGRLFPKFMKNSDPQILAEAKGLCDFFNRVPGRRFGEVEEELKSSVGSGRKKSLAKLLLDRCDIAESDPEILDWRWSVFAAAEGLREQCNGDFQMFAQQMQKTFEGSLGEMREKLFSDLPSARFIKSFESMTGWNLLVEV